MQEKILPSVIAAKVVKIKHRGETRTLSFDLPCTAAAGQYFELGGGVDPITGQARRSIYLASASAIGEPRTKFNYKIVNPKSNPTIDALNKLKVGDTLQLKGPCGDPLVPTGDQVLLIGAGTALTTLRNMERNFTAQGKHVEIIYSAKKRPKSEDPAWSDVAFPKKLLEYEGKDYNYITYTQENVHHGAESFHLGRIDKCLSERRLSQDMTVFVCGPPEFENSVIDQLLSAPHHYDPNLIYVSSWGKISPINGSDDLKKRFKLEDKQEKHHLEPQTHRSSIFANKPCKDEPLYDAQKDKEDKVESRAKRTRS